MQLPRLGRVQMLFAMSILALVFQSSAVMASDAKPTKAKVSKSTVKSLAPVGYPDSARLKCISGAVAVEFTIEPSGNATKISVVKATAPGVFDNAAIDSVKNSSFKPRIVDGKAEPSGYRLIYRFSPPSPQRVRGGMMQAIALTRYRPKYPPEALINHIEATVLLAFTVDADGTSSDVSIIEMSSRARSLGFGRNAKSALSRSVFAPKCVNGEPKPFETRYKYTFALPDWVEY